MNPIVSTLMAGILPFGACFIELFFIFSVSWTVYKFSFLISKWKISKGNLGESILLFVWVFVLGVFNSDHLMCGNLCGHDIFPAVRRRLPLVVAIIRHVRRMRSLRVFLRHILLHNWGNFRPLHQFNQKFNLTNFHQKLDITEFVPTLLYFGYSFLISFTLWIITGTIGFFSSYFFVSKIYAAVKID